MLHDVIWEHHLEVLPFGGKGGEKALFQSLSVILYLRMRRLIEECSSD